MMWTRRKWSISPQVSDVFPPLQCCLNSRCWKQASNTTRNTCTPPHMSVDPPPLPGAIYPEHKVGVLSHVSISGLGDVYKRCAIIATNFEVEQKGSLTHFQAMPHYRKLCAIRTIAASNGSGTKTAKTTQAQDPCANRCSAFHEHTESKGIINNQLAILKVK